MSGIVNSTGARSGVIGTTVGTPDTGIADNSVTLAKMAGGTDGNLITYDTSGDPAYVATGTSGHVLTSAGADAVPSFQATAATAITSDFTLAAGLSYESGGELRANYLNGLVFLSFNTIHSGLMSSGETIFTITDSDYYPSLTYVFPTISYQADSAVHVIANTGGTITIYVPNPAGIDNFYICVNGCYRTD